MARPNDPVDAPIPVDAEIAAIDAAPADAAPRGFSFQDLPEVQLPDSKALFVHLAARLFVAPDALWTRVGAAQVIARGTVRRSEIVTTGKTDTKLFELEVQEMLRGTASSKLAATWPAPDVETSDPSIASLPVEGTQGIVLLGGPAPPVVRKVAPGARVVSPRVPLLLPEQLARSIAIAVGPQDPTFVEALRTTIGPGLQILLGAASKRPTAAVKQVLVERAAMNDPIGLLARATLYQLGDRKAALDGFDYAAVSAETLAALGIHAVEKNGKRYWVSGPKPQVPIRWER